MSLIDAAAGRVNKLEIISIASSGTFPLRVPGIQTVWCWKIGKSIFLIGAVIFLVLLILCI